MTIRARLTLSYLVILLLLGFNLVFSFWSDSKRQASFEDLRRAIARQNLISAIEQGDTHARSVGGRLTA